MSEIKEVPVRPVMLHLMCECGGEMFSTGEVLLSDPPLYPHRCNKCWTIEQNHEETYPHIARKALEEV